MGQKLCFRLNVRWVRVEKDVVLLIHENGEENLEIGTNALRSSWRSCEEMLCLLERTESSLQSSVLSAHRMMILAFSRSLVKAVPTDMPIL